MYVDPTLSHALLHLLMIVFDDCRNTPVTNFAVRRVDGVCVCMRKEDETRFDGIGR